MAKRLYIGGLPFAIDEDGLKAYFSQAGTVAQTTIVRDRMQNNRSRGFGFVEFDNDDEAIRAIEMFNGKMFEGRTLTVSEARPMEPRAPRASSRGDRDNNSRW